MNDKLNAQITREFYSSYLYLSMSAWFQRTGLRGHAHWMRRQSTEEQAHVTRMYNYLLDRDGTVTLESIEAPPTEWESALAVFEHAYCHEVTVTRAINALVDRAVAAKDHATATFLQWYVTEQVEEEATFKELVDQLKMAGAQGAALLMLDRELATRTFVPPAQPA